MKHARPDFYAVLGVPATATQTEITRAYRVLLREYHPDMRAPAAAPTNANLDVALQHVLAAYAVLRDPARRAEYDREVRRQSRPATSTPLLTRTRPQAMRQPPIVAGPVHWRRPTPSP